MKLAHDFTISQNSRLDSTTASFVLPSFLTFPLFRTFVRFSNLIAQYCRSQSASGIGRHSTLWHTIESLKSTILIASRLEQPDPTRIVSVGIGNRRKKEKASSSRVCGGSSRAPRNPFWFRFLRFIEENLHFKLKGMHSRLF